ncbi:MAG TPA: hypothetical protein V6D00_12460 [Pantanalinema sp.]
MTRRAIAALAFALALASPAGAWELGSPYGRIGWDLAVDDHVSGQQAPDPLRFARGNADASGALSLGAGQEIALDDDRILTLSGGLRGSRYALYPEFSRAWGSLSLELATYDLLWGWDAFWGVNAGGDFANGRTGGLSLGLERSLWGGVTGALAAGAYRYLGTEQSEHAGGWGELSLRRRFGSLGLTVACSLLRRGYQAGGADASQALSAFVTWQLYPGLYLKASAERNWNQSDLTGATYAGGLLNMGSVYYAF